MRRITRLIYACAIYKGCGPSTRLELPPDNISRNAPAVEAHEYADPGEDRGKAERRQALAAAAVAMHTASLSNDLQYVGRRHNLLRSRANAALMLPATFYTSEKAKQLLFSLTQRGVATRRCKLHGRERCSSVSRPSRRHSSVSVSVTMVLEHEQDV